MQDLISRSALLNEFIDFKDMDCPSGHIVTADYMIELVENAPAVDAEPVRHGMWLELYKNDIWDCYKCSECGAAFDRTTKYCSCCGAKMMNAEVHDGDLQKV